MRCFVCYLYARQCDQCLAQWLRQLSVELDEARWGDVVQPGDIDWRRVVDEIEAGMQ